MISTTVWNFILCWVHIAFLTLDQKRTNLHFTVKNCTFEVGTDLVF